MKTRSIIIVCALVLIGAFCLGFAVPLANPAYGQTQIQSKNADLVVGYYLTREHLDLYDHDAWIEDNIDDIIAGKYENPTFDPDDLAFSGMNSPYAERVYAELREKTLTADDGHTVTTQEYVFPGIEGIAYFAAYIEDEHGGYHTTISGDAIIDGHAAFNATEEGEERKLEGTICFAVPEIDETQKTEAFWTEAIPGAPVPIDPNDTCTIYFNPVCQAADGSVYLTAGLGFNWSSSAAAGGIYSQTVKGESTVTIDGERKVERSEITVHVKLINAPTLVTLTQMNADNQAISSADYLPGTLPEEIVLDNRTAYLICETRSLSSDGEETVSREIIDRSEESLSAFYAREDGLCLKQWTQLVWQ